ncbi:hypothetical protein AGMMS50256_02330 [Betaproteobacteria bacterium]|nr:hypothetical protein AGMMS50256_02330 [Betaproteobacteria bacterium]
MKKLRLFDELTEGFDALAKAREGKLTLCVHELEMPGITQASERADAVTGKFQGTPSSFLHKKRHP